MSFDINHVLVIGRLSADPELKHIPSGMAVCKCGIAVGGPKDKAGNDQVDYFNFSAWGKTAEALCANLKKGDQLAIDGRLKQNQWKTQAGENRSAVEIVAERIEFLQKKRTDGQKQEPKKESETSASNEQSNNEPQGQRLMDTPGHNPDDSFYDMTGFDPSPLPPDFDPEQYR